MDHLASDAERDRAASRLRDGAIEGRLEPAEFERRLGEAYAARTQAELTALVADLPAPRRKPAAGRVRLAAWAATSVALTGAWAALAGARALTDYAFVDWFWPIVPIAGGAIWVWRSRVPRAPDRRLTA